MIPVEKEFEAAADEESRPLRCPTKQLMMVMMMVAVVVVMMVVVVVVVVVVLGPYS